MNGNNSGSGIKKVSNEIFGDLGEQKAGNDFRQRSLRQMSVIYHLLHDRLDRPLVEEKYWPGSLKLLREELDSALSAQEIPESWLKAFLPGRKSGEERTARELYTSSLQPLLAAAREVIEEVLKKLREIESQAEKFRSPYRKRQYIKLELATLSRWALRRAWEVYNVLSLDVSRHVVGRPRQEAEGRNNGSSKAAQCVSL
jgi:hypothetical protein